MYGNVFEWCQDWFDAYPGGIVVDPKGPATGWDRVFRGGDWDFYAKGCRSAGRYDYDPDAWYYNLGFRVLLAPGQ